MELSKLTKSQLIERIRDLESQIDSCTPSLSHSSPFSGEGIQKDLENQLADIRRSNKQLAILNAVSRATAGCRTPKELCFTLVEEIRKVIPLDSFALDGQMDGKLVGFGNFDTLDGQFQQVPQVENWNWETSALAEILFGKQEPLLVLRKPQPSRSIMDDLPTFGDHSRRAGSLIYVPLIVGCRTVGVIAVMSYQYGAYTQEDVDLLIAIGTQVAPAIQGVSLTRALVEKTDALSHSEGRLKAFAQAIPDVAFILDEHGRYLEVLTTAENLLHCHAEELKGCLLHDLFPKQDADRYLATVHRTIQSGQPQVCVYCMEVLEGTRWFEGRTAPMQTTPDGKPAVVWIARDITQAKEAETVLRENERFLQNVFDAIQDGLVVLDRDMNVIRGNTAIKRWYRHVLPLEGSKCFTKFHQHSERCDPCPCRRALQTRSLQSDIIPYRVNGEIRGWFELYGFPILDETGQPQGVVEYVRDITKHREAEQALQQAHQELERRVEQRTADLVQANQALRTEIAERQRIEKERKRLVQSQQDFMANVSHELKTPLTSIRGYAETLLAGAMKQPDTLRSFLEIIHDNAVRMGYMTHNLLQITLLESGGLELERRQISVADLIESSVKMIRLKAEQKEIVVHADYPKQLPSIHGDSHRLREVLQNLLDNALQYSPSQSRVMVKAAKSGEYIKISVIDQGLGIPASDQSRVFERLYRVDRARSRKEGGTGLGLAIVKELVEAHNGFVVLQSEQGKGSTFSVYLPIDLPL